MAQVAPPEGSEARLSILIVNWNSRDLLRQCLISIRDTCADLRPQVVVVDGGSFDGCAEMMAAEFADVDFVQSEDNIGFGRSNNLGFTRVTGEMLLLLNPDTEIRPGAIETLLTELQRLPEAGLVSPRLLNSDLSLQTSIQALPRPIRQALDSELLRRLLWRLSYWAPPTEFAPAAPLAVEAVSGACMALRTRTFREVGGFSPEYFMYAEDMDLCLKVRRAGLRIYHVPQAEILHHGGASSSAQGSKFSAVMTREALHTYMKLNHGWFAASMFRLFTGGSAVLRLLLILTGLLWTRREGRQAIWASASRWWSVVSWSAGFERWATQYPVLKTTAVPREARP